LAVTQQVVKQTKDTEQARMMIRATLDRPLAGQNISDLVNVAAQNTIEGFLAQDRLDFDGTVLHWSQVFHALYPELDAGRIVKAAQAFASALFAESKLKDDNSDPYVRVHDEKWQYVRNELVRMCELLDLPSSFGIETSDFYRYHSTNDNSYVKHVIEFHRVLMKRHTGQEKMYRELAGLYLSALAFHDQHTLYGVKKGRELMKLYYTILFETKYGTSDY
jgi:hypothetical protein